jgi:hypothetical protein
MKASVQVFFDITKRLNELAQSDHRQYMAMLAWIAVLDEAHRADELLKQTVARCAGIRFPFADYYPVTRRRIPTVPEFTKSERVPWLRARSSGGYTTRDAHGTVLDAREIPFEFPLTTRQQRHPEPGEPGELGPLGPSPHSLDDLRLRLARRFADAAWVPVPKSDEAEKENRLAFASRLASRLAALYCAGYCDQLHQCQERECNKWFLARKDAVTCSPECREKMHEQLRGYTLKRRKWKLEDRLIPRAKARLRRLMRYGSALRREKWQRRLDAYQLELKKLKRELKKEKQNA